jgi:hypothetical protein
LNLSQPIEIAQCRSDNQLCHWGAFPLVEPVRSDNGVMGSEREHNKTAIRDLFERDRRPLVVYLAATWACKIPEEVM